MSLCDIDRCFITYGFLFSWIVSLFSKSSFILSPFLFLPIMLTLYLVNSMIILMANWQISRSRETVYSISFPILP